VSASLTSTTTDVVDADGNVVYDAKGNVETVTETTGFIYEQIILATLAFVGVLFGIWLWLDDINYRNG
jgi:hypothetical protein